MNLNLLYFLSVTVLNPILLFLSSKWIEARITASIKAEYDRKLADYQAELRRREQALGIAEMLATFHYNDDVSKNPKEFMQLAWELSIWLPADIVIRLSKHLIDYSKLGDISQSDPKLLLIEVRKILHGSNDNLSPDQIIHYIKPLNKTLHPTPSGVDELKSKAASAN